MSQEDTYRMFSRRAFLLGLANMGAFGALAARLGYLQVAQYDKYQDLAEENRINLNLLAPPRGHIVDVHGTILARNEQSFSLFIIPERANDVQRLLNRVHKLIPIDEANRARILARIEAAPKFVPTMIHRSIDWQELARIELNLPALPGIEVRANQIRHYPYGEITAHPLGYVGYPTDDEMTHNPLLRMPGFHIGKTGIERHYEGILRGQAGRTEDEVNALGRKVREVHRVPEIAGQTLNLTLDYGIHSFAYNRLGDLRSGAVVVMDAHSGAVRALVSYPGFDTNLLTSSIDHATWDGLLTDPTYPLINKAIAGQYPPGSTFKMITAIAALEHSDWSPERTVFCPGHLDFGKQRFHCWKRAGHGHMNCRQALTESCDTYFYTVAEEIGIEKLAAVARRYGLGELTELDTLGEKKGLIPDPNWKRGRFSQPWQTGETLIAGIGQGYILTTPLQLATMTARMVNGGKEITPYLNQSLAVSRKPQPMQRHTRKSILTEVSQGMIDAVNDRKGTAFASRHLGKDDALDGIKMGGKTGTAQVRRISMEERRAGFDVNNLPWKYRHHALFVGYAPVEKPRYVCAVVVEHGGSGSSAAAPVCRDVLAETLRRDPEKMAQQIIS